MIWIIVILVGLFAAYEVYQNVENTVPDTVASNNGFINAFANAIASFENVGPSANNPGGLTAGDVDASNIVGTFNSAGVVIIDTLENGWTALINKLQNIMSGVSNVYSPDMTISQFVQTYTGSSGQDATDEAQSIADDLGVTPDTSLSDAQDSYNAGQ